ncbi:hypothetical protein Q604_UNBC18632G0004 [human gut metagenome]|uniref:DUF4007 domain-containing protein n=1 Tax=human gut metagenome TaxID=408170 RepID=W1WJX4_9ZZZZ|nr:hypothetical protein [Clostridium butyricum]AXB84657.1 hypothetical protein DRB99_06660 [Clostridium butyricum]
MFVQVNLNFHQTFKPERQYISSILSIADGSSSMNVKTISACTGIPQGQSSGKVEPHINYAKYMGLIKYEKKDGEITLKRTNLGDIVFLEDPGLQEDLSILLSHGMMLRERNGAELWSVIFKKILPLYKEGIKKDILMKELQWLFDGKANKKNVAPFMGSYEDIYSSINILKIEDETLKLNSLQYNKEFIFLYAYILWEYWEEMFNNQEEISSLQLNELRFGKAFGWSVQSEYEVLEHLSDRGLIRLNRQLMPYTLLKLVSKEALAEKLYSELC